MKGLFPFKGVIFFYQKGGHLFVMASHQFCSSPRMSTWEKNYRLPLHTGKSFWSPHLNSEKNSALPVTKPILPSHKKIWSPLLEKDFGSLPLGPLNNHGPPFESKKKNCPPPWTDYPKQNSGPLTNAFPPLHKIHSSQIQWYHHSTQYNEKISVPLISAKYNKLNTALHSRQRITLRSLVNVKHTKNQGTKMLSSAISLFAWMKKNVCSIYMM